MKSTLVKYRKIANVPQVRRLLAADAISKAGDWFLYVAMSTLVFRAGGAGMLAAFTAMRVVIPFVLGPWAGRWGTAVHPRSLMVGADAARATLLLVAALAAHTHQSVWLLEVLVAACAVLSAFHGPAERRFQRDVVEADQRGDFNAVLGTTGTTVIVLAPALGGVLSVAIGNVGALVADAVSFLASAGLIVSLRSATAGSVTAAPATIEAAPSGAEGVGPDRRTGTVATILRILRNDPVVLACVVTQAVACTVAGASLVLIPLLADRLQAGPGSVGWLTAAVGAGSVAGMLTGGAVARQGRLLLCVGCIIAMGPVLGILGSSPNLAVALGLSALAGAAANIPDPMYWTSYAARVAEADSGPFYGLVESSITGGFALGGVVLGVLAATLGMSFGAWALGLSGSVLAATALVPAARHHRTRAADDSVASLSDARAECAS